MGSIESETMKVSQSEIDGVDGVVRFCERCKKDLVCYCGNHDNLLL